MTTETTEIVWMETEFFIVTNEDGNVTGDEDRDAAIERMADEYGGQTLRVTRTMIRVPRPRDAQAELSLPVEGGETIRITATE